MNAHSVWASARRPPGLDRVLVSPALARLVLFFLAFEEAAPGMRELQRRTGLGSRSLQNELRRMLRLGWICRYREGRTVRIRINRDSTIWRDLRGLALATARRDEWRLARRGNEDLNADRRRDYDGVARVYRSVRYAAMPVRAADAAVLERVVEPEWREWYSLSPQERWAESAKLWRTFSALGGSLDPDADWLVGRRAPVAWRTVPPDRRPGVRVVRRSGV
jgi:hypothetical protein